MPEEGIDAPKGVVGDTVSPQDGQDFGLHTTRNKVVIALIAARLLETIFLT